MRVGKDATGKLVPKPRYDAPLHLAYKAGDPVCIQLGPSKCKFLTPYPKELYKALSAPVPGFAFTPSFKNKMWDGQHRFITKVGYFQLGLLPVAYCILKTGINPLVPEDKKGHKVLANPVEDVQLKVPKEMRETFYPGLVNFYIDELDILQYLNPESGEFAYPVKLLQMWSKVRGVNPLAETVLDLAKSLRPT